MDNLYAYLICVANTMLSFIFYNHYEAFLKFLCECHIGWESEVKKVDCPIKGMEHSFEQFNLVSAQILKFKVAL